MNKFSFDLAVLKVMRQKHIKQTQLAAALGVTRRTLFNTIKRGRPTIATCERYAEALGVSLPDFIREGYYS